MTDILEPTESADTIVLKDLDDVLFQYQPISDPEGIRLLTIEPGQASEKVTCTLSYVSLATNPEYEALSYTWGDNHKSHSIRCGNGILPITANLHSALQRFRYHDRPRILWADAICINQADIPERNQQVRQMKRIYKQAREVLIWLGEEQESDAEAFELFNKIDAFDIKFNGDTIVSQTGPELLQLMNPGTIPVTALANIFQRSWFSRVWVIQEIAMASKGTIFCGTNVTTWSALRKTVQLARERGDYGYLGSSRAALTTIHVMACVKEVLERQGTLQMPIPVLLATTQQFFSTDPRDRIFAMLNFISGPDTADLLPDYMISKEEVYMNIAIRSLNTAGTPFILSFAGGIQNATLNIPSWVPNWIPRRAEGLRALQFNAKYNAAVGTEPEISVSNDSKVLTVTGFKFDQIQQVSRQLQNQIAHKDADLRKAFCDQAHLETQFFKECIEIASVANPYPTGEEFEDAFIRLLTGDLPIFPYPTGEEFVDAFIRLLTGDLPIFDGLESIRRRNLKDGYQYWRLVQEHLNDIMANTCSEEVSKAIRLGSEAGQIFSKAVDRMVTDKSLCRTDKHYLGWTNAAARIGDIICIISGTELPYVLRPDGEGFYRIVGECYIQGIMRGEAMESGSLVKQEFKII